MILFAQATLIYFPEDVIAADEDIQFILQVDSVQLATLAFAYITSY